MRGGKGDPAYEVGEALTRAINGLLHLAGRGFVYARAHHARRRAEADALAAELEAERQAAEWLEMVRAQMARGSAGFASPAEARDALRERGGPVNDLDDIMF